MWYFGGDVCRGRVQSFGAITLGSWNHILCWTWLLSAITLGRDADPFTTWLLYAIKIGWKADSFTTWLISAITIRRDDELLVLAETSSSLSITVSGLQEVLIPYPYFLACNFETYGNGLFFAQRSNHAK